MKRFISMFYLFIMCCAFVIPFNSNFIYAADDAPESKFVMYQALTQDGTTYKSISAVSQYYYTNTAYLGQTETTNRDGSSNMIPIAERSGQFSNLYDYNGDSKTEMLCSVYSDRASDMLCRSNNLLPALASLRMNAHGDVVIELANGVTLATLHMYYILANRIDKQHLYCSASELCENSLSVLSDSRSTNWSNKTQDSTNIQFTESTIENKFNVIEKDSGDKVYSGYNIFDHMTQSIAQKAEASGVYVISTFSVNYNGIEYFVNRYSVSTRQFSNSVSNNSNAAYKEVIISNAKDKDDVGGDINSIASNAALVKPKSSRNIDNNRSFSMLEGWFIDTLRPILIIAVGVLFVIVGTHTGVTIVKSSDEPEVRKAAIKKFIGLFVGAFAIAMILLFYKEIIVAVQRYF